MNALEREYRLNLQRSKERELRRVLWTYGALTSVAFVGFGAFTIATTDWSVPDWPALAQSFGGLLINGLAPLLAVAVVAAVVRIAKWHGDRKVVVTTTDRERSYRAPTAAPDALVLSRSAWPRVLRSAAFALVWVVGVTAGYGPRTDWRESAIVAFALAIAVGVVVLVKRIYGTWRSRRDARLRLKWDHWLESADSCKVGTREWTE